MAPIKPPVTTPPYRVAACLRAQRGTDELGVDLAAPHDQNQIHQSRYVGALNCL